MVVCVCVCLCVCVSLVCCFVDVLFDGALRYFILSEGAVACVFDCASLCVCLSVLLFVCVCLCLCVLFLFD